MPSTRILLVAAAALALSGFANAQTNITEKACASSSSYSSCNRDVANKWSSCVKNCNGDGNCIVDCGCDSHQKYINCMAESCWNQVHLQPEVKFLPANPYPGLLLQIPTLHPTILRRLSQSPRANPLLASTEQRPEPLFLRHWQSPEQDPLRAQRPSHLHEERHRQHPLRHHRLVKPKQRPRHRRPRIRLRLLWRQRQHLRVSPPIVSTKPN
jgi:hypothetical protein